MAAGVEIARVADLAGIRIEPFQQAAAQFRMIVDAGAIDRDDLAGAEIAALVGVKPVVQRQLGRLVVFGGRRDAGRDIG